MDARTREALEASIRHWEELVADPLKSANGSDCALCVMFANLDKPPSPEDCSGCPVAKATGLRDCHGTPFYPFRRRQRGALAILPRLPSEDYLRELSSLAQAELDFLVSLRPTP